MTEEQVRAQVERLIQEAGSLRALARRWKITPSYLSDLRFRPSGRRTCGPGARRPVRIVTVRYEPDHGNYHGPRT